MEDNRKSQDFKVHKFHTYSGPSLYLNSSALVFNLIVEPDGPKVEHYVDAVSAFFPKFKDDYPGSVVDLFAEVLLEVNRMDMELYLNHFSIEQDGPEWTVAMEYLDEKVSKECAYLVSDWFRAITEGDSFPFASEFEALQKMFDKSLFGGPTIYSLVEGGLKRGVPVKYLFEENQFQWGYGKKQRRGRSTIFHTDGIKDTEFTSYKDMVADFLNMCGFPTPMGHTCFLEDEVIEAADKLGYPLVIKPVAGHKGIGVTTGITSLTELKKCFHEIKDGAKEAGVNFDGTIVQQQIYGYDHRILTIGGKYAATLKRIPAYVVGNGKDSIRELIRVENEKLVRLDNARSPLAKIRIDQVMHDFLTLMGMTVDSVPADGEEVVLRRVANISAGGVSINVTKDIHPKNIEMVENIAKFFHVTALGIDVLAKDISRPWNEGDFGIIEINAGPGVFMHLAPAEGGTVDIPGKLMDHFFGPEHNGARVPIVAGNDISEALISLIHGQLKSVRPEVEMGSVRKDGVYFNDTFFTNNPAHDKNCSVLLRNPKLDLAVFNHEQEDIHDFGIWHMGADVVVLVNARYAEETVLKRQLMPGSFLLEANDADGGALEVVFSQDGNELGRQTVAAEELDQALFGFLEPHLAHLLNRYEA